MDDLFGMFGDAVAGILSHPLVQLSLALIAAYLVILWLASAYWTFRDLRHRTRDPLMPYVAAGGVVAMTPFAFPLALLAYRVVRPPETLAERRTRDLESYVLQAEVAAPTCVACGATVHDDWMRCPACGTELATACRSCGGRIEPDWSVCAWCARDLEPFGLPTVEPPATLPVPVMATSMPEEPAEPEARGAIPGWRADPEDAEPAWSPAPTATAGSRRSAAGTSEEAGRGTTAVATRERESPRSARHG